MRSGQSLDTTRTCELGGERERGRYVHRSSEAPVRDKKCGAWLIPRVSCWSIAYERRYHWASSHHLVVRYEEIGATPLCLCRWCRDVLG